MSRLVLVLSFLWIGLAIGGELPAGLLPDSAKTPGVADPALTAEVLCAKIFTTRDVRSVPQALKRRVYALYGMANHKGACARSKRGCEVDHLISLELGGANDVENLWPEPFGKPWGAEVKDKLENRLHKLVCAGEIDLDTAQREITTDWIAAYRRRMK
ncbi:MAG TPA: HNH endonuclease signature motif containing protein [Bradyrhizobium sp.]|nr:HNH endonuclease signature motif containing protein [Bradyrhizobium sp.]